MSPNNSKFSIIHKGNILQEEIARDSKEVDSSRHTIDFYQMRKTNLWNNNVFVEVKPSDCDIIDNCKHKSRQRLGN